MYLSSDRVNILIVERDRHASKRGHFEYLKNGEWNRSPGNVNERKSFLFTETAGWHVVAARIVVAGMWKL